jgi:hypothetical protein
VTVDPSLRSPISPSRRWWLFAFVWWTLNGVASAYPSVDADGVL